MTRRQFLGSALVAGAAVGCRTQVQQIVLPTKSPDVTQRMHAAGAAHRHVKAALTANDAALEDTAAKSDAPADFVVDVHCHTFNALDIPIDGFIRSLAQGSGLPPIADHVLGPITRRFHNALVSATPATDAAPARSPKVTAEIQAAKEALKDILAVLSTQYKTSGFTGAVDTIRALLNTVDLITTSRRDVAQKIATTYYEVELFTPALVDFGYWINRDKVGQVLDAQVHPLQQIEAHAAISAESLKGGFGPARAVFHPYAAFNPWRDVVEKGPTTILAGVQNAVENLGFVGVKIYPPCGFLPYGNADLHDFSGGFGQQLDDSLDALYTWCVEQDVPLLTHASMGNSFFPNSSWRGAPWGWRRALEKHPKLRVCFGHFGHLQGIDGTSAPVSCLAWAEQFLQLMQQYPNVYGDLSDSDAGGNDAGARADYQARFLYWLCNKLGHDDMSVLANRFMYGSDWWMGVVSGIADGFLDEIEGLVNNMAAYTSTTGGAQFKTNFWGHNALRFLGIWDEKGQVRTDGTAKRLRARYDALKCPIPRWLALPAGADAGAGSPDGGARRP